MDVLPLAAVRLACVEVLNDAVAPVHYATLTERALARLCMSPSDVNFARQKEDVREKILQAGQHDLLYLPKPYCSAIRRLWLPPFGNQLHLGGTEPVSIPGHAQHAIDGAFEMVMRWKGLNQKNRHAELYHLARARSVGFVGEKHVAYWFRDKWPKFYRDPANAGKWARGCDHDFVLCVTPTRRRFAVDVSMRGAHGWTRPEGKPTTDLHLQCSVSGSTILWHGVQLKKDYAAGAGRLWHRNIEPLRLCFWLNCYHAGIDYDALAACATRVVGRQ